MSQTTAFSHGKFGTKDELVSAYVVRLELGGMDHEIARIVAKDKPVYVPHIYRGGWVIRGFGYSCERIGKYVTADAAGVPEVV